MPQSSNVSKGPERCAWAFACVEEAEAGARLPWTERDRGTECTWGRKCGEPPGEERGRAAASGAQGL